MRIWEILAEAEQPDMGRRGFLGKLGKAAGAAAVAGTLGGLPGRALASKKSTVTDQEKRIIFSLYLDLVNVSAFTTAVLIMRKENVQIPENYNKNLHNLNERYNLIEDQIGELFGIFGHELNKIMPKFDTDFEEITDKMLTILSKNNILNQKEFVRYISDTEKRLVKIETSVNQILENRARSNSKEKTSSNSGANRLSLGGKSIEFHVGRCTAFMLHRNPNPLLNQQKIRSAIENSAASKGLDFNRVMQGYNSFKPGDDCTDSCRIASEFEKNGKR